MPKAAGPEWPPLVGLSQGVRLPRGLGRGQQVPVTDERAPCTFPTLTFSSRAAGLERECEMM